MKSAGEEMDDGLAVILTSDVTGLLARDVAVTMANISRSGCLLESTIALAVGTVAMLLVKIQESDYGDAVRVIRCTLVPGAGERHHIGVEFLQLESPGSKSLRQYAASLTAPSVAVGGAAPLRFELD